MPQCYQQLFRVIEKEVTLSQNDKKEIENYFSPKKLKKNTVLLHAGEVAKHIYFVLQGALHQYYTDEDGNEKSCAFVFENEFSTDLESFSNKSVSSSYIAVKGLQAALSFPAAVCRL